MTFTMSLQVEATNGVSLAAVTTARAVQVAKVVGAIAVVAAEEEELAYGISLMATHVETVAKVLPLSSIVKGRKKQVRVVLELRVGSSFATLVGQAQISREVALGWCEKGNCSFLMGKDQFIIKHAEIYLVRLMGPNQFDVSPIRQWDPGGNYL